MRGGQHQHQIEKFRISAAAWPAWLQAVATSYSQQVGSGTPGNSPQQASRVIPPAAVSPFQFPLKDEVIASHIAMQVARGCAHRHAGSPRREWLPAPSNETESTGRMTSGVAVAKARTETRDGGHNWQLRRYAPALLRASAPRAPHAPPRVCAQ